MKFPLIFIVLSFCLSALHAQSLSKKELSYKPKNLNEAVAQLHKMYDDSAKQKLRSMTEREFMVNTHFGLGMWIRNNWGLWRGQTLADYFNSIGIFHPDDMSAIILKSFHRDLNGKNWEVDDQIKSYQEYWKQTNEHFRKLETDTAYQNKVRRQDDSLKSVYLQTKQLEWTKGKKVSGYLSYQCGFLSLGEKTKVLGTIVEWKGDIIVVHIETYVEKDKKEKVIKCNEITDDNVSTKYHGEFTLMEK